MITSLRCSPTFSKAQAISLRDSTATLAPASKATRSPGSAAQRKTGGLKDLSVDREKGQKDRLDPRVARASRVVLEVPRDRMRL